MILNWGMQQSSPPTLASYRAEMSKFTIVYTLRILVYILVNLLLYEYIYIYTRIYNLFVYVQYTRNWLFIRTNNYMVMYTCTVQQVETNLNKLFVKSLLIEDHFKFVYGNKPIVILNGILAKYTVLNKYSTI